VEKVAEEIVTEVLVVPTETAANLASWFSGGESVQ
jgi:hypothetical protein